MFPLNRKLMLMPCNIAISAFLTLLSFEAFRLYGQDVDRRQAKVNVEEKGRTKSNKQKAGQDGHPRMSKSEIYLVTAEKQLIRGIDQLLKSIANTLARVPKNSPQRQQLMERAHNLHLEQATYVSSQENRAYDDAWQKWDASGRKGTEPKLDERGSRKHWSMVATSAAALLKEFPKSPSADVINLNQAMSLMFLGKESSAARAFTDLIKRYPNSKVVGDAYYALGDYYFDINNFRNALSNYSFALKYPRSKRFGWALFKSGWAHYNTGNYQQALAFWKKTVSYSRTAGAEAGGRLKDEALRDMVYAFAELKLTEPAITYFRVNGGQQYIGQFLTLLAQTYTDQGQYQSAIRVWQRLQSVAPMSEDAFTAQSEIISLAYELGLYQKLWQELARFPQRYGKGSPWASKQEEKVALEKHILILQQTLYYAKVMHKKAQKGNENLLAQAAIGYMLFLKNFPKAKQSAEAKFNLADIEYTRKKYRSAGNLYFTIVMMGPKAAVIYDDDSGKPVENIHMTSARYMLDAYHVDFKPQLAKVDKVVPSPKKPARPLSVEARNFIKGCGLYVKSYPKDQKLIRSCDVTVADAYYRFNHIPQAIDGLWQVAKRYPKTKDGPAAVDSLIPLIKDNKKRLYEIVSELLKIPEYSKGKLGEKLRAVIQGSEVEAIQAEKDAKRRAIAWANHAKRYPNDPDAEKAWNNAAVDFLKAGMVGAAATAYATIVGKYPKSALVQESLMQLATISKERFQFDESAKYYTIFAQRFPKSPLVVKAVEEACYLLIASNPGTAVKPCAQLAAVAPPSGIAALERLYDAMYFSGDTSGMNSVINNYFLGKLPVSPSQKIVALCRVFAASGKSAQSAQRILEVYKSAPNQIEGEALRCVGEVVFSQYKALLPKTLQIGLQGGTVQAMQGSIEAKSQAIAQLESSMGQVVSIKDPYWGVAALYSVGAAYADLGKRLSNPPTITGAKPEDVKKQLAPLASGALEKANEIFGKAATTAKTYNVLSAYTGELANAVVKMKDPNLSFDDLVVTPDLLGSEISEDVAGKL